MKTSSFSSGLKMLLDKFADVLASDVTVAVAIRHLLFLIVRFAESKRDTDLSRFSPLFREVSAPCQLLGRGPAGLPRDPNCAEN